MASNLTESVIVHIRSTNDYDKIFYEILHADLRKLEIDEDKVLNVIFVSKFIFPNSSFGSSHQFQTVDHGRSW